MSDQGSKMTYFRVETTAGWTHLEAKNLREAKTEALILRAHSLATTGSRYCLLTKHKDDSKPGFVGTQIGEWKMSNVKASGWTAIYISAVTSPSPRLSKSQGTSPKRRSTDGIRVSCTR